MTLNTDLSYDKTRAWSDERSAALKAKASEVADHARVALDETGRKAKAFARTAGAKSQELAARTAEEARRRPIATGAIIAVGAIALFFLTNRKAREAVLDAGSKATKALKRETRRSRFGFH